MGGRSAGRNVVVGGFEKGGGYVHVMWAPNEVGEVLREGFPRKEAEGASVNQGEEDR